MQTAFTYYTYAHLPIFLGREVLLLVHVALFVLLRYLLPSLEIPPLSLLSLSLSLLSLSLSPAVAISNLARFLASLSLSLSVLWWWAEEIAAAAVWC